MSLIDKTAISRAAKYRLKKMLKMHKGGYSLESIGLEFGICKQRVSQIFQKHRKGSASK